jgi:hypothetical protein
MEKKVIYILLAVIIFLSAVFFIFIVVRLNGENVAVKQDINKVNQINSNSENKSGTQASSTAAVESPKPLTEQQKNMTAEEKKKLGLWESENVQAVTRDVNGNVTAFEFVIDPNKKDSDGDGLSDEDEAKIGTNPNNPDTDGDGVGDLEELRMGHNPLVKDDYGKKIK